MKKNKEINNTLIKRNNLIKLINKEGINRTSPEALIEIEKEIKTNITQIIKKAKENMIVNGRATLKKEDIESFDKIKKEKVWEI